MAIDGGRDGGGINGGRDGGDEGGGGDGGSEGAEVREAVRTVAETVVVTAVGTRAAVLCGLPFREHQHGAPREVRHGNQRSATLFDARRVLSPRANENELLSDPRRIIISCIRGLAAPGPVTCACPCEL